jgi:hypothetical protein
MPRREHRRQPSHRCLQRRANSYWSPFVLVPDDEFLEAQFLEAQFLEAQFLEAQFRETQVEASRELQLVLDPEFL